jgi:transketolase
VPRFDPQDPIWPNRDRFVPGRPRLDAAVCRFTLTGVRRQQDYERLGSRGPRRDQGVPAVACAAVPATGYRWTSHRTTTGPLKCSLAANSVGMARRALDGTRKPPGFEDLIDFNVYALCGDGCMMEGISWRPPHSPPIEVSTLLDLRQ